MYELESRSYSLLHGNIWSNMIDLIACIQGHMFWIYSAMFCLWEESYNHPVHPLDNVKISSTAIMPSKPAAESKRSSDQTSKPKSIHPKATIDVPKAPRSIGRSHDSTSTPCLRNASDHKSKAPIPADSTAVYQRKKRDQWQTTISQMMKRREPKNQVSSLQKIRLSTSTPHLPGSYQAESLQVPYKIPRRSTAPSVPRMNDWRPSIHEERHGITKPPKWWWKMTMGPWKRRNSA